MTSTLLQQAVEARRSFEAWYEADAMPCEADWFKRDPDAPDEYDSAHTQVAWKAWQSALQQQPEPVAVAVWWPGRTMPVYFDWISGQPEELRKGGARVELLYTAALQQQEEPREVAAVPIPLADAQMLLAWMDETFGNDSGTDWHDADAAAVGDALDETIENFKRMRSALAASPSPQDFTLPMVEEGKGTDGVALPPPAQPQGLYVECRECGECGHAGINDEHPTDAACNSCDWRGPSPKEDHCPGCGEDGTMTAACPKCGCGRYTLVAGATLGVKATPDSPAFVDWEGRPYDEQGEPLFTEPALGVSRPDSDPTSPRTTDGGAA